MRNCHANNVQHNGERTAIISTVDLSAKQWGTHEKSKLSVRKLRAYVWDVNCANRAQKLELSHNIHR